MQRILLSLGMIVFVGALAAGATGAFFSDTETSTGNTFAAGSLDLRIDSVAHYNGMVCTLVGQSYVWIPEANVTLDPETMQPIVGANMDTQPEWDAFNDANPLQYPEAGVSCTGTWPLADIDENSVNIGTFFDFDDIKPGDEGENTISIHVDNNDAWMCVALQNVAGADPVESATEPEDQEEDALGDIDHGNTLAESELDENLFFFAWADDGDNIYEASEQNFGAPVSAASLVNQTWALADSTTGNGPIQGDVTGYIGVYWCAGAISVVGNTLSCDGAEMGNEAQTDSWSADLQFYIEQSRNNEDFRCNPVTELPSPILTLEKQVNQDGVDPVADSAWTLTATGAVVVSGTDNDPGASPAITNISVPAGAYTLTETGEVPGFTFQGIQCTDGTLVGNVLTLVNGDNATCTFTNIENVPAPTPDN